MVIAVEQYRSIAERGNALRFGHPPVSSDFSVVQNRFSFVERSVAPPGQQVNEYFTGSTFGTSGNQTADGTHYDWTILYQRENYDAMPGVYQTGNGAFNPRQQSLLAPDLSVIQQGISAYDPLAGETGFQAFLGRSYRGIAFGASALAGTALSIATWGMATPWVAAGLGVEATSLGILGTAAVGAISGIVGGAASGFAYSAGMGESSLQIAESTGENALFGGITGGAFGAAGGWLESLSPSAVLRATVLQNIAANQMALAGTDLSTLVSAEQSASASAIRAQLETMDFATDENGAVFWSGWGQKLWAQSYAALNGVKTIEMTEGGGWLESLELFAGGSPVSDSQAKELWEYASERFASCASGRATVFFNNPFPNNSMFTNIEAPILWNRGVLLDFQSSINPYPGPWDLSAARNYH